MATDLFPAPMERGRRRLLILLMGALVVLGLSAGQLSLALFTDQDTVDGTFSTGSIDLDAVKIDALSLTTSGLMPGDTITVPLPPGGPGASRTRPVRGDCRGRQPSCGRPISAR